MVHLICNIISDLKNNGINYSELITFVSDRPGHDLRYSIDISNIRNELKWSPKSEFKINLINTVKWYSENLNWCKEISLKANYHGDRLGKIKK